MLDVLAFNRKTALVDETLSLFLLINKVEITVNFVGILYYIMNVVIDYRTRSSMNNVRRIHLFIYFACPFNQIATICQKILIIFDFQDANTPESTIFQLIQFVRLLTAFTMFVCLPAYATERCFATYFYHDYEKENRSYIGYSAALITYFISIGSVLICLKYSATFYPFLIFLVINIISFVINLINYKVNEYYYSRSLKEIHIYSLTERYQISENIRLAKVFHIFAITVAIFTTSCSILLLLAGSASNPSEKNLFTSIFDVIYLIYTLCAPYVHYRYNATWQNEFNRCMKTYTSDVQCATATTKHSLHLKTTFGERMNVGKSAQSDVYFNQLVNTWNTVKPEP